MIRKIVVPLLAVFGYVGIGIIVLAFGLDNVAATLVADAIVFVLCFLYLRKKPVPIKGDGRSVLSKNGSTARGKCILIALLFIIWLFGQISASWVLTTTNDASYYTYLSTLQEVDNYFQAAWSLVLTLVAAPLCEEFLMRGVLFSAWCKVNPWFALFGSATVFAVIHGTLTHLIPVFLCGLVLAVAYAVTGNIWFTAFLHAVYNAAGYIATSVSVPTYFFYPAVFLTIDALLVLWCVMEFRHARATDDYDEAV